MAELVAVGALLVDLLTSVPGQIPDFGESINVEKCLMCFGGKAANVAAQTRLLGGNVDFIGKVGDDMIGNNYLDHFKQLGVGTASIGVSNTAQTGVAQIISSEKYGKNAIAVHFGANLEVSVEDIRKQEQRISAAKCLVATLELPVSTVLEALRIARLHNLSVICNPSPRRVAAQLRESSVEYNEFLKLVDFACLNELEATIFMGENPNDTQSNQWVAQIVERIQSEFKRVGNTSAVVICTLGERGVAFWNGDNQQVEFIDVDHVQVADTTGAGDSFIGAFAYFLLRHGELPLREKVRRAAYIATSTVTKHGAQISYSNRSELDQDLFH